MKILIITEYFPQSKDCETRGGVETRCFYIARELAKRHNVTVISSQELNTSSQQVVEKIKIIRCGTPKEYCQVGAVKKRLSFMKEAYQIGRKIDVDLVEGADFPSYLPAYYISKKQHIPAIAWYNDVWIGRWMGNIGLIQGIMGEILERFILKKNWSFFIANSNFTQKNLLNYGIDKEKVKVIYCGVDIEKCMGLDVKKDKEPNICCVSRLVKYKKIDVLIKAISYLRKKIQNIQCNIIGIGPELEKLKRLVREMDLENNVRFLGYIKKHKDVLKIIKRSQIFCLPSIIEGFGIVVIEAMACSTPYVCSDIAALKEVTNNGIGGMLFEEENPYDLAQKILCLLTEDRLYEKCIRDGLKLVQRYSWKNIANQTEMFYEEVRNKFSFKS